MSNIQVEPRNDRLSSGALAHPSSEPLPKPRKHVDGTELMPEDELKSAGIVDDAGRKIVPGQAFLMLGALFFGVAVVLVLGGLAIHYFWNPS
jgi:hypothetical protein